MVAMALNTIAGILTNYNYLNYADVNEPLIAGLLFFHRDRLMRGTGISMSESGWPDWAIFRQLGYFWRLIIIFWKDEVAQNNSNLWGYFLLMQIYHIFTYISSFKTWFLRFQKRFDLDVSGFQIELYCRYFGLFWLGNFLGYFWKIWQFFSSLLVTLVRREQVFLGIVMFILKCFRRVRRTTAPHHKM